MNSADVGVVLFVLAAVAVLIWFALSVWRDVRGIRTTASACARIGRRTRLAQAPLGRSGKIHGYEITER